MSEVRQWLWLRQSVLTSEWQLWIFRRRESINGTPTSFVRFFLSDSHSKSLSSTFIIHMQGRILNSSSLYMNHLRTHTLTQNIQCTLEYYSHIRTRSRRLRQTSQRKESVLQYGCREWYQGSRYYFCCCEYTDQNLRWRKRICLERDESGESGANDR